MRIKAITFDLDGVIADLVDAHYIALNEALDLHGLPIISREDQDSTYNGLPTRTKLKLLGVKDPELVEKICQTKQELTAKAIADSLKTDVRLIVICQQLKDRGYPLALASNSIRQTVDQVVAKVGLTAFFEFTLSNQDVHSPKPHPEIYLKAAEKLAIKPWEMLVVEDSPHGQRACLEAGARLCVVRNTKDVTLQRILESIEQHEAMGYFLSTPEQSDGGR